MSERRIATVLTGLLAATALSVWFGLDHPLAQESVRLSGVVALVVAAGKIWFIGQEFMEVRTAPIPVRVGFATWLVVVTALCLGFFLWP